MKLLKKKRKEVKHLFTVYFITKTQTWSVLCCVCDKEIYNKVFYFFSLRILCPVMYSLGLWELCFLSPSPTSLLTFPWRSQKILVKLSKSNEHRLLHGTAPGGSKWMVPWSCVASSYRLTSKSLGKSKWQYSSADQPHSVQVWFLWICMRKLILFLLKRSLTFDLAGWFCKQKWNILSGILILINSSKFKNRHFYQNSVFPDNSVIWISLIWIHLPFCRI